MATLVAIGYPDQGTAEQARGTVQQLEAELIIQADQVVAISRDPEGKYHVHTTHGGASTGAAYVVPAPGGTPSEDELKAHIKSQLARYKVPREIYFLEELPRKSDRKAVAQSAARDSPGRTVDHRTRLDDSPPACDIHLADRRFKSLDVSETGYPPGPRWLVRGGRRAPGG
jgi:acyl-CoA synthetase (AMP-forming)/AMP-acid ligase II